MNATFTTMAGLVAAAAMLAVVGLTVAETVSAETCRVAGAQLGVQVIWRQGAMGDGGGCYQLVPGYGWTPLKTAAGPAIP
jgi:hypothetical protein